MWRHVDGHKKAAESYRIGHAGYVSEFTQFMDRFLEEHPDVAHDQMTGLDIFWDHSVDFQELEKSQTDKIPMKNYDYF